MTVEENLQLSTQRKDDGIGKEVVPSHNPKAKKKVKETSIDELDLDEDIVIPNWDLSSLSVEKMDILEEL